MLRPFSQSNLQCSILCYSIALGVAYCSTAYVRSSVDTMIADAWARRDSDRPASAVLEDSIVEDEDSPGLDTMDALDESAAVGRCVCSRYGRSSGVDGGNVRMHAGGWCLKRIERGMSVRFRRRRRIDVPFL